jgi:1-deoxy-D-xylulose-5-phosphate reductoisomerase
MKKIIIFGATGSIGTSTIGIIRNNKDFQLVAISYLSNHQKAKQIVKKFNIKHVIVGNDFKAIDKLLKTTKPDLVVNAVSASDGLIFSYLTIINKIDLVLANKETLVC